MKKTAIVVLVAIILKAGNISADAQTGKKGYAYLWEDGKSAKMPPDVVLVQDEPGSYVLDDALEAEKVLELKNLLKKKIGAGYFY